VTAFLLSALGIGNSILKAVLSWLSKQSPATLLCIVLALLLLVDHGALLMSHRHERKVEGQLAKAAKALKDEQAARAADRQAYTKAQTDAAAKNKAQVAATEQQYKKVSDDEKDAYARDHAELVRMRAQRDAAERAAGAAGSPKDSAAGPATDGHGVPVSAADDLQKTRDDAADIELRLMHLQNYVAGILGIDPNGDGK
jgi:hypothetical protein